jgi:hypothetical protein
MWSFCICKRCVITITLCWSVKEIGLICSYVFPSTIQRKCYWSGRLCLKCDGTRAETRFRLSAKQMSPFKSVGASVQSTTGNRGVRISGSNAGYTMFRGRVKSTGYPLHSPVSPSLPLPYVTVCHHISTGLYCRKATIMQLEAYVQQYYM